MTQQALVINLNRCGDSRACSGACKQQKNVPLGSFWTQTFTSTAGEFPGTETYFLPKMCQHCRKPPCVPACPMENMVKREDGIVLIKDSAVCAECEDKPCLEACPYEVIFLDEDTNTVGKCDLCADLVDQDQPPACAYNCNSGAIIFGDIDDPESHASQMIAWGGDRVFHLLPESGAEPAVCYILHDKTWQGLNNLRLR